MKIQNCISGGIPENGLVLYAEDSHIRTSIPRTPLNKSVYNCGNEFIIYEEDSWEIIGIISSDNTESAISAIRGGLIIFIEEHSSGVSGKHGRGGQSQRRYMHNRERELHDYYKRVAEGAKSLIEYGCSSLIMAGPWITKRRVYDILDYRLKSLPVEFIDCEYSGSAGVYQVINRLKEKRIYKPTSNQMMR